LIFAVSSYCLCAEYIDDDDDDDDDATIVS